MTATPTPPSTRRRRSARKAPTGDEREQLILEGAEALLAERSVARVSAGDIAAAAGISRSTLYFYFATRDDVFGALAVELLTDARKLQQERVEQVRSPREVWGAAIGALHETFTRRRPLAVASLELRASTPRARETWEAAFGVWVAETTMMIEAERQAGNAPDGPLAAADLALALNLMNERVFEGSLRGDEGAIALEQVPEVLTTIWTTAIYGGAWAPGHTETTT